MSERFGPEQPWACDYCGTDCWPRDLPDGWERAVELIEALHEQPNCLTGGPLHIELDDGNLEDHWWTPHRQDSLYGLEAMRLADEICAYMKPLTIEQRAAVLVKWDPTYMGCGRDLWIEVDE